MKFLPPEPVDYYRSGEKAALPYTCRRPFLNDCNDEGPELVRLFSLLRGAGAELHYIYIPCSPIHGNSVYWSPISKGPGRGQLPAGASFRPRDPANLHGHAHRQDGLAHQRLGRGTGGGKRKLHVDPQPIHARLLQAASRPWPTNWTIFGSMQREPSTFSTWHRSATHRYFWDRGRPGPIKPHDGALYRTELTAAVLPLILRR
jgi:hypothetical protein